MIRGRIFYFKEEENVHIWAESIFCDDKEDRTMEINFKQYLAEIYKNCFN